MLSVNEIDEWIEENKRDFVPPVCNKCMFSNQLKVFFVGGPNQRLDFHLEEGEEVFYQKKGGMILKVIENGKRRDIPINEGEIFLLPRRVEHSPQRFAETIGFVVERTRKNSEFDCVRYFVGETTERLFERWIHLTDVVKDLPPVINEFKQFEKTATPSIPPFIVNAPYEPRDVELGAPINLDRFLEEYEERLRKGPVQLYGPPTHQTEVTAFGVTERAHWTAQSEDEGLVWLKNGSMTVEFDGEMEKIAGNAMIRIDPGKTITFSVISGHVILIAMPTYGNQKIRQNF